MRLHRFLPAVVAAATLMLPSCAPVEDDAGPADSGDSGSPAASAEGSASADECATDTLALKNAGRLTVGTDSPAFEPWFVDNDPSNGEGFESAVAYAVAEELGFSDDQVDWVKVPFNNSYAPGEKD